MNDEAAGTPALPPPPPWERGRPARARVAPARTPLSRERIVDAAFTVLDRQGLDGLSMRQVAAELGVTVSALYAHVSNKDDLLQLMYNRVFQGAEMPEPDPERWQERLRDYARAGRRRLLAHRDMARISMAHVPFTAELLPHVEAFLGLLRTAGLPDRIAAEAGDLISTYIDGFVLGEDLWRARTAAPADGGPDPAGPDLSELAEEMRDYFASLPEGDFPHLRALAGLMVTGSSDERFDIGLEIILRGLASYLPGTSAGGQTGAGAGAGADGGGQERAATGGGPGTGEAAAPEQVAAPGRAPAADV
ncbi:TetR/AcrR family transcriptional regulator [Streptomyces sp. NPDC006743]|uniref:TetR/AcrR family transcriptional regulator n=1 Tax=Streptomyces sp. NPDC006743 TaxID=3154480 RepID=UPI0034537B77